MSKYQQHYCFIFSCRATIYLVLYVRLSVCPSVCPKFCPRFCPKLLSQILSQIFKGGSATPARFGLVISSLPNPSKGGSAIHH